MKLNVFDVVELENSNRAIIKEKLQNNIYNAEIVENSGKTKEFRTINEDEIRRIIYKNGYWRT